MTSKMNKMLKGEIAPITILNGEIVPITILNVER